MPRLFLHLGRRVEGVEQIPQRLGQYWLAQPFVLAIIVGLAWVGSRARSRLRRSKRQPLPTEA